MITLLMNGKEPQTFSIMERAVDAVRAWYSDLCIEKPRAGKCRIVPMNFYAEKLTYAITLRNKVVGTIEEDL